MESQNARDAIEKARKDYGDRYLKPLIVVAVGTIVEDGCSPQPDEVHYVLSKYFQSAGENPPLPEDVYKEIENLKKEKILR